MCRCELNDLASISDTFGKFIQTTNTMSIVMLEWCLKKFLANVKRWEEFNASFFTIFRLIG